MPTISSSRVQPLVTPSTALLTRARANPCRAAWLSLSRSATRCPSFCSILIPRGSCVSSLPFGPWTATTFPWMFTFTSLGMAIGFLPILDMFDSQNRSWLSALSFQQPALLSTNCQLPSLPDLAQDFAAHAFLARLAPGHDAARSGQDVDAHAAQHARNLAAPHVHPATGLGNPRQIGDGGFVVVAVLQINPQHLVAFLLHRFEVGDIALFLENAGNLQLQLGGGHIHFLVAR